MWKTLVSMESGYGIVTSRNHYGTDATWTLNRTSASVTVGCSKQELERKNIRVTVEEEVSECCEKWRAIAADRCEYSVGPCVRITAPKIEFCPECGERL